jgi:hypothetical protein
MLARCAAGHGFSYRHARTTHLKPGNPAGYQRRATVTPLNFKLEILPEEWADALIYGDWDELEKNNPDEAARAKAWQIEEGLCVVGCNEEPIIDYFDGRETGCLTYLCVYRH